MEGGGASPGLVTGLGICRVDEDASWLVVEHEGGGGGRVTCFCFSDFRKGLVEEVFGVM